MKIWGIGFQYLTPVGGPIPLQFIFKISEVVCSQQGTLKENGSKAKLKQPSD